LLKAIIILLLLAPLLVSTPAAAQSSTQFAIPPNYYEYLPLQFPGTENMSFGIASNVTVNVYVMTQQQFAAFNSTGYSGYIFSASGTLVNGTVRGNGTYYLVVDNNISSQTANVILQYAFQAVNITYYPGAPVPTGIVDYGVMNRSGTIVPYKIMAKGITGFAEIYSIGAYNSTPPINISPYGASLQLNIDMQVNTTHGTYVYWLQDVADFNTNNDTVSFVDNIWNSTSSYANMSPIPGNGSISPFGNQTAYIFGTQEFHYSLPLPFLLSINIFNTTNNQVQVQFSYQLNGSAPVIFDTPAINASGLKSYALLINGFNNNPSGVYYDAELVFGGEGNGEITNFSAMNAKLNMWYTLFNGSVMEPYSVYTFGGDTLEAADNLQTTMANGMPTVTLGSVDPSAIYSLSNLKPVTLYAGQPAGQYNPLLVYMLVAIIIIIIGISVKLTRWKPKEGVVYKSFDPHPKTHITTRCTWPEISRFTRHVFSEGEEFKRGQPTFVPCTFSLHKNVYEIHMNEKIYFINKKYVHVSKKKIKYDFEDGKGGPVYGLTHIVYQVKIKDVTKLSTTYPPPP